MEDDKRMTPAPFRLPYEARVKHFENAAARRLLETISRKKSNLSVALDVTRKEDFLAVAEAVGPFVCVLKTHIDVVEDFDADLLARLSELSRRHDFLVFEDRKFADIGNTVKLQYGAGIYKIAEWSHFTNAHIVPGEGIVDGLKEVGMPKGRGLLLLAEMSSKGTMAKGEYTMTALEWARRHRDFVFGFIGQRRLEHLRASDRRIPTEQPGQKQENGCTSTTTTTTTKDNGNDKDNDDSKDEFVEDFLYLTPGVQLASKNDALGQQYRTPRTVILEEGCDVIIVGRGIYGGFKQGEYSLPQVQEEIKRRCKVYMEEGWKAYLERCDPAFQ